MTTFEKIVYWVIKMLLKLVKPAQPMVYYTVPGAIVDTVMKAPHGAQYRKPPEGEVRSFVAVNTFQVIKYNPYTEMVLVNETDTRNYMEISLEGYNTFLIGAGEPEASVKGETQ